MDRARIIRTSKFLSKHLRHDPKGLGLTLQTGGWVAVNDLLAACQRTGFHISRADLDTVVAENDKQRFAYDATGTRIRANQGHSVEVDLQLEVVAPPPILYHGTGHVTADAIERDGLRKMRRHHVHLSTDVPTALRVGARHGKPVIFEVDSAGMQRDGFKFFCSENGVWLVDEVPPKYLRRTP